MRSRPSRSPADPDRERRAHPDPPVQLLRADRVRDDSLDSINATASAIVRYASQRAGIPSINAGRIRGLGSPIRGGEAFHTGCILLQILPDGGEVLLPGRRARRCGHPVLPAVATEVESLLVLKNNRGVEENRVRHMDYGVDQQADVPAPSSRAVTSPCSPRPMHRPL